MLDRSVKLTLTLTLTLVILYPSTPVYHLYMIKVCAGFIEESESEMAEGLLRGREPGPTAAA